jgi:hypothetical protein
VVSSRTRKSFHLLVGAMLTIGTSVIGNFLTAALTDQQSLLSTLGWGAAGIIVTFFYLRWQLRSGEESPEAIKEQVSQLHSELRSQVQSRSYGTRSKLIAAPLKELDLDITPRLGWVRDPRLTEPEPLSERKTDIVAHGEEGIEFRLEEFRVPKDSTVADRTIGELRIGERTGAIVFAFRTRDGKFDTTPSANDRLRAGDTLIVLGSREQITRLEALMHGARG